MQRKIMTANLVVNLVEFKILVRYDYRTVRHLIRFVPGLHHLLRIQDDHLRLTYFSEIISRL